MTARHDITGWSWLPLPALNLRLRSDGVIQTLTGRVFSLDVKADHDSDTVLLQLEMTLSTSANGLRLIDTTRLRPQVDAAAMEATYAALCAAHRVRAGGDAVGVYDLRSRTSDRFVRVPIEGRFIIKGSAARP